MYLFLFTFLAILLIVAGMVVENFTELVIKDEFTEKFRMFFFIYEVKPKFLGDFFKGLFSCGRCFSGWVSLGFSLFYTYNVLPIIFGTMFGVHSFSFVFSVVISFILWNLIWYLSNITHHIRDRINPNHPYKDEE